MAGTRALAAAALTIVLATLALAATCPAVQAAPARQVVTEMTTRDYYNRGLEKDRAGDYQGAIADYSTVLGLNPKDASAAQNLALARRMAAQRGGR